MEGSLEEGRRGAYGARVVIEDVEGYKADEVEGHDDGDGEEEVAFEDRESLFRGDGCHAVFFDEFHFRFLFFLRHGCGDLDFRCLGAPTAEPERYGHDCEIDGYEHGAGEVSADADEAVGLHEQVEEEALVEVLKEVVQTAENAFHAATQCHFVFGSVANWL